MELSSSGRLPVPNNFQFPFTPYHIQDQFMRALFTCLEEGQLGIFESPTGTGKSLSLICGALTWYLASEKKRKEELEKQVTGKVDEENEGDDWFAAAGARQEARQARLEAKQELERIVKREERMERIKSRRNNLRQVEVDQNKDEFKELFKEVQWMKKNAQRELSQGLEDEDILVEEYFSDEENGGDDIDDEEEEEDTTRRIFFCSRTHSQLSQFVREVKKSPFGNSISLVSLASRSVMCVNPSVSALKSQTAVNERCLDLKRRKAAKVHGEPEQKRAKKGEGSSAGCPYNRVNATTILKENALLAIRDIEELVAEGRKNKACPYYASRQALPLAQMVVLPYNTLLHAATRKAVGLNLKRSIVIIDEAHNLLETITGIHSVGVGGGQLALAYSQLTQYREKYSSRLKAKNLLYIKQILFILTRFIKALGGVPGRDPTEECIGQKKEETNLVQVADFLTSTEIYNLQLLKLIKYCHTSQICHKLTGFAERYKSDINSTQPKTGVNAFLSSLKESQGGSKPDEERENNVGKTIGSPLLGVVELLSSLALTQGEARLVITRSPQLAAARIRFLLLDPANQFQEIVKCAHSVIVAGGTMRPMEEFRDQLFLASGAPQSRVTSFSCDHVVPGSNLLPLVLKSGPSGVQFEFSYNQRALHSTIDELGRALFNIVTMVPCGVVVFLPSYDYEQTVVKRLTSTGQLSKIESKKKIFREPKGTADLDKVLAEYATSVRLSGGALLLAVVGGKMSEGINFSDGLGRAVVMVGLPYPNLHSPELKEKMSFLNRTVAPDKEGKQAGQVHYENLCMKAVNQSVGRAIRHKEDYAAIIFLDHRFARSSIISQLPSWISRHLRVAEKFGPTMPAIKTFFKSKES